ncbi:COG4705 family protein [Alicyclobacillus vulcanalis]|uniref:Uncharacterized membrane-anchored protein n=1 Tax=Alicyclobacillus vulcanalis TaxID=252246 RepID=A0A1N7JJ70_9BACL|nr:hypothetical protein [Alicyclobacillus vulcanalis]SIS49412.1 Uncharacterized membrane-anchored protein [Alicyclobacillus vulcanalis]
MSTARVSTRRVRPLVSKVPEITVWFWIVKLFTTAMGEATSDFLVLHFNKYLAVLVTAVVFLVSFVIQYRAKRYVPYIYWTFVTMVAVFGTMVADAIHIVLGVPYWASTTAFAILLAAVFISWYRVEHTLDIHSIVTKRRELFYWAAVLATFAMGTACGDMTATTLHLGYFASGILFVVLFGAPFVLKRWGAMNEIFAFWFSYVMTRPLGASFADWLGVEKAYGGLGLGRGAVALSTALCIVVLVSYLTITSKDRPHERLVSNL